MVEISQQGLKPKRLQRFKNPKLNTLKSNLIGETGLDLIRSNAEGVINLNAIRMPARNLKKYGRNEIVKVRYKDGTSIATKYKKVAEDLKNGLCIIIEE